MLLSYKSRGLSANLEGENLSRVFVSHIRTRKDENDTYIVLSNSHNVVLGNTSPANTFNVGDRYVAHHFTSRLTNSGVPLNQDTVAEHSRSGAGRKRMHVPDWENWHKSQEFSSSAEALDNAGGPKPIENHVFQVLDAAETMSA